MKKLLAVLMMTFAVVLFVGCAEEPVEEEILMEDEAVETAPDTEMGEPMMDDTVMTDTDMMGDTAMTDTTMEGDTVMTDTEMEE